MKHWLIAMGLILCLLAKAGAAGPRFCTTEDCFAEALQARPAWQTKGIRIARDEPSAAALIHFDFDSAVILPDSYAILGALGRALQNGVPDARLEIRGHTDSDGSDDYNLGLSLRRAEAVKQFLLAAHGIAPGRLTTRGYGEARPIRSNGSEEGRAHNRRVELVRVGSATAP